MTDTQPCSDLTQSFEAHDIGDACFGHREHLLVAFELLGKYEFIDAASIYARGIQSMAAKAGIPDKFNLTITYAFLSLIAERMAAHPVSGFDAFAGQNPDLFSRDVLSKWYAPDRLNSEAARRVFLMPEPQASVG